MKSESLLIIAIAGLFALRIAVCPAQIPTGPEGLMSVGRGQKDPLKVGDHIYQAIGFGNTFIVKTDAGSVVIDTSIALMSGGHKRLLDSIQPGEIKFIILTHGHGDHTGGVKLWKGPDTQVIAQKNFAEFMHYQTRLKGFFDWRNAAQFARAMAPPAADKKWPGNRDAQIDANILFEHEYKFELGGLHFECYATPGETPDHLTVWIPELKAAFVGDNFYDSFPNMYTLRGTQPRWALDYVDSIDRILALKPEILLPSHGMPREGNEKITQELTKYRAAILYVHDATVKGMNDGKDVHTLMREVKLPPELNVGEGYGRVAWSVRGIYEGYAGWFDGNPSGMFETPVSDAYSEMVKLAGGPEAVAQRAKELIESGEVMRGLHMADMALKCDPASRPALEARLAALTTLDSQSDNFNEKNWLNFGIRTTEAKLK